MDLNILETNSVPKTVIFDGMTLVNWIKKDVQITTCKSFVHHKSKGYDKVRLIFDHYQENSIKDQTRNKRTQENQTRYKITNDTNLYDVTMKKLLSHVLTKQDLTEFLGNHLEQHFRIMEGGAYSFSQKYAWAQIFASTNFHRIYFRDFLTKTRN